jgi:hypothetical protein
MMKKVTVIKMNMTMMVHELCKIPHLLKYIPNLHFRK